MKRTIQELADALEQATLEYSELMVKHQGSTLIDKQLWGALHIGWASALEFTGYSNDLIDKALDRTQEQLKKTLL